LKAKNETNLTCHESFQFELDTPKVLVQNSSAETFLEILDI